MGTTQVTMREAKARLYGLGELAQTGERIVIIKGVRTESRTVLGCISEGCAVLQRTA